MARQKKANAAVNWQERGAEFRVGDVVTERGRPEEYSGRVTAVYPAIGMVDIQFPHGSVRRPVEDLQRWANPYSDPPHTDDRPGGEIGVTVSGGPYPIKTASIRVAKRYMKALYWASKDRKYRATRSELASGKFISPRAPGVTLVRKPYKRRDGGSEALYICPESLFLIKDSDIMRGRPQPAPLPELEPEDDCDPFIG